MKTLQEIMTDRVVENEAEKIANEYFDLHEGQCPWCEMKYVQKGRLFNHIVKEHHNRIYRSAFNRKLEEAKAHVDHRVEHLKGLCQERIAALDEAIAGELARVSEDPIDGLAWRGSQIISSQAKKKEYKIVEKMFEEKWGNWEEMLSLLNARREEVNTRLLTSPHRNNSTSTWHNVVEAEVAATKAEFYNEGFGGYRTFEYELEFIIEMKEEVEILEAFEDEVARY